MLRLRKLSPTEIAPLDRSPIAFRAQVAQEYDAYLADFVAGDYGRVELGEGERRILVRQRLQAAARRRGLALRFRSGPGPLTFRMEEIPVSTPAPPLIQESQPYGCPSVAAPSAAAPSAAAPPRSPRRKQSAAERYRDVLPRWMRSSGSGSRREGGKRRAK